MNRKHVGIVVAALACGMLVGATRAWGGANAPTTAPSDAGAALLPGMKPIFDGRTLDGWTAAPAGSWVVKDGAMASIGAGRGYLYTNEQYDHYRLIFTMRHVSGKPDHQACVLIFCATPPPDMDALGGIQFQPPNGGHWDYRKGHNNAGKALFVGLPHAKFDPHEWSRVELLVNAATGTARMAVAQPVGAKAVEVADFKDPSAGRKGPIAWQMHNKGLFDEYKDVQIEVDPKVDELITVGEK